MYPLVDHRLFDPAKLTEHRKSSNMAIHLNEYVR